MKTVSTYVSRECGLWANYLQTKWPWTSSSWPFRKGPGQDGGQIQNGEIEMKTVQQKNYSFHFATAIFNLAAILPRSLTRGPGDEIEWAVGYILDVSPHIVNFTIRVSQG